MVHYIYEFCCRYYIFSGIQVFNIPCCEVSNSTGLCEPGKPPCPERLVNLFYDDFHPSETVNILTATRAYNMLLPGDAYPTDIHNLIDQEFVSDS